jgi:GH24 family phage-related lysozyme (muramidase)
MPGGAVLVERGTGCVLQDPKGKVFQRTAPVSHPPTSGIDKTRFVQHLRTARIEAFVPYMYKDSENFVTVGIGHLLRDANMAKVVPFVERGTNKTAHENHRINAFNKVKNSPISGQAGASAFEPLTNIVISEADAISLAESDMDEFIRILRSRMNFPEFDTYPETAKMGLLDMAYTSGVEGIKNIFPNFTLGVRHRDWNFAADQSNRPQISSQRNQTVHQWFKQAEQKQTFFASVICNKRIDLFFQ